MSERRTNLRNLCSDVVELFWSDRLGWPQRLKVILEDISPKGACLQSDMVIPLNVEIALRLGEFGLPGIVRYCTLINGAYFVGVEFAFGTGWKMEDYNPKHILEWPMIEPDRDTLIMSESFSGGAASSRC